MLISPPVHLPARLRPSSSRWELALRYLAATLTTLLAIGGAQLVTPGPFIWVLTALTLLGGPVSLWLRLNEMRVGSVVVPRPLLNSLTVVAGFIAAPYFVHLPLRGFIEPLLNGNTSAAFWLQFGNGEPVQALMQLFLLFAVFRSFAIISDKDATLTTVPSFSVLLLLIPIQHGIEIVLYFIAWTFVAATLFALDHRSEVRAGVSATVPAGVVGQDARLGARSLATILGVSLLAAIGFSMFLSSRNPEERSQTETAVTALASRLTNLVLALPEMSSNGGPERQIDFKNGPSLPSRALLWQVEAFTVGRQQVRPTYWRMFSLSNYNGLSWTQSSARPKRVPLVRLPSDRWPQRPRIDMGRGFGRGFGLSGRLGGFIEARGFDIERNSSEKQRHTPAATIPVWQSVTSQVPNLGFLPVQPDVRILMLPDGDQKEIRLRDDGSIDIGIFPSGQGLRILSGVPALPEYGFLRGTSPQKRLSPAQIAASGLSLSPAERELNLRLPATVPARVHRLAAQMLQRVSPGASNNIKATRIALAIQQNATYTLRPPSIPDGHDATDYFLHEGARRGYCTYFAGALTVLCRSQGIPARVVSGFANIKWEGPEAGMLREANAHAWTEVWVDGFGWIIVDATPDSDRGDNAPTWAESWADWLTSGATRAAEWAAAHQKLLLGITVSLGLMWLWGKARGRRWLRRGAASQGDDDFERRAVSQSYARAARAMSRRFRPKTAWETPDEWLQSCAATLSGPDAEALRRLTALYLRARYGTQPLPPGSARLARETAAGLGWKRVKS